ncbi:MAG: hypothetical protein U9O98_09800 [Asgard group archaeon]|nr:hypothetical protein [Asgard group archaeon]
MNQILVAIYHSHSAPPKPSKLDQEYMTVNRCVWLISSFSNLSELKGYLLVSNDDLKEIEVVIK